MVNAGPSSPGITGDTGSMKTLVGPLVPGGPGNRPPSHPTGDIGNMQTLVSDVAGPPSAVRTGSHPSDLLRRAPATTPGGGVKTGSHGSGLRTGSGTLLSGPGPSATPSGTRFPISGSGSSAVKIGTGSASGVVQTGMAGGKRWTPSPEDIAEVHGDNQLGNLQPVENGRILGQYILMKKLGQGGMGAVYRGIKMGLNTDVAIKILFAHLAAAKGGSDHQARFLREAQLAASLDNPNLVRVIDVQQDFNSGILYLVMEFVEGYSVADLIKDKTDALAEEEALELIIGACKGLRAAHQQNIVHRDIKPDNIMIRGRDKVVKVADMGLAKAIGDQDEVSVSRTESVIGTPAYMAPEQARDSKHVDLRADIYSMGATLFHMTTLRLPFEDPQLFMLLKKVITEPVPDPRTYNEKLSENLSRIIKKCMAKQPDNRYQRIDELIDDLEIALRNTRGEKDAVVDDIKLVVPEMEPEAPRPWYLHPITWAAMFLVVLGGAVYGAWYFATGGLSPFEQSHNKAVQYIEGKLEGKAEEEIGKMKTLAKGPDEAKIIADTEVKLTNLKYQNYIDEGRNLLERDKQYTKAGEKFLEAQKLHDNEDVKGLIEAAKMGPFRDEILRLIKPDVAKFDDARTKLAEAATALTKSETWLANHPLNGVIALAEAHFRVNEQLTALGKANANEGTVKTAMAVATDWLAKTGSNTEISTMIDEVKKVAVKNVFQPRAEAELRDEKFDDVPKSIDWIKQLSPGDKLIDTLTTRLNDARQAKDNRERREKADKLLADADKLMGSKSTEKIAETQDIKLLEAVKNDYVDAQKVEDYPRDAKGDYIVDPKTGKKMPRRSDQGLNVLQDLIDRYNVYQRYIKDGDDRLEFQRYDDAIEAYISAGKTIKTDQVSQRITRASDRKSNHEAIQNIEATIVSEPIKAASLLQDKLEKVPDDADLLRVKAKLIQVTRPDAYEIADLQARFRLIPGGTFTMGNEKGEADEKPVYQCRIKYPFYMGVTEVTVKQFEGLIPTFKRPLDATGRPVADEMPVTNVSWEDAARYAQLLTDREKVKLKEHESYRLPTESEWEYAARGTDGRMYPWGDNWQEGYCQGGSDKFDLTPTVVGSFPSGASPFGILDLAGNVSEFCQGGYSATRYAERAAQGLVTDPRSSDDTNLKVVRGGSAFTMRDKLRATKRFSMGKKDSGMGVGFRLVRTVEPLAIDPP
jgi:serine/threonine protein kinase/formylglycine-generating enzyme required for sulfatase activity